MMDQTLTNFNPTSSIDISFNAYVERRRQIESKMLDGHNIPNYAYAMDYELRKKLDAIPGLYKIGRKICGTVAARETQRLMMSATKVGPTQFPDVYEIVKDCARILGIGIPNVFIYGSTEINAFTYAYDDIEPMIVIYSAMYERFTLGELRCIIGPECGHIHNMHGVYDMLGTLLINGGLTAASQFNVDLTQLLFTGASYALKAWSRAGEVTCDRAGMICAENIEDAYSAEAKLLYGATFKEQKIDYQALREQLKSQMGTMIKYEELERSHPTAVRRIAAEMEFAECEVLYQWRPELKKPGIIMRSKKETDERCRAFIDLTKKGLEE